MPKKPKTLTRTLYTYVEPANREYAIREAKKQKIVGGYSGYINQMLTDARKRAQKSKAA